MKLKDITPGMAIRCTDKEQTDFLKKNGYTKRVFSESEHPVWIAFYKGAGFPSVEWMPECSKSSQIGKTYYASKGLTCVEFTDLILSEPELTTAEILQICTEICDQLDCNECPMKGGVCFKNPDSDKETVIAICKQWKSDHEEKGPEVEWVWEMCVGSCGYKEVSSEEEAREWCEKYVKAHPEERCFYKHICRKKEN